MGAGIAQLAARAGRAGAPVRPARGGAPARARQGARGLAKEAAKGALGAQEAQAAAGAPRARGRARRVRADCELVIEAAPERLELKHELLASALGDRLRRSACWRPTPPRCWSRRSRAPPANPERVVGMHFFNPAPRDAPAGGRRGRAVGRARARARAGDRAWRWARR